MNLEPEQSQPEVKVILSRNLFYEIGVDIEKDADYSKFITNKNNLDYELTFSSEKEAKDFSTQISIYTTRHLTEYLTLMGTKIITAINESKKIK